MIDIIIDKVGAWLSPYLHALNHLFAVSKSYPQTSSITIAVLISTLLLVLFKNTILLFCQNPNSSKSSDVVKSLYNSSRKIFSIFLIVVLSIMMDSAFFNLDRSITIETIQSLLGLGLLFGVIHKTHWAPRKKRAALILLSPIIVMLFTGGGAFIAELLDVIKFTIGNHQFTLFSLFKTIITCTLLVWLSRKLQTKGQKIIRSQKQFNLRTRELFAKVFEIVIYCGLFLFVFELIGVDLTSLAIFGGAIGVGLGFGLQSITSNFISGVILLLDRSLSVGDHIELEDGKQGIIRQLNLRSATVETYDGKDILVPNEKFISTTFVNWTHANDKQRYSLNLQVSYKTDLNKLFDLIRSTVSQHPQVLSGEEVPFAERPDAEICGFGDSGVDILIEFWMVGIDDGDNRVGGDLLLMIWEAFREHFIEIPYPQREITILNK